MPEETLEQMEVRHNFERNLRESTRVHMSRIIKRIPNFDCPPTDGYYFESETQKSLQKEKFFEEEEYGSSLIDNEVEEDIDIESDPNYLFYRYKIDEISWNPDRGKNISIIATLKDGRRYFVKTHNGYEGAQKGKLDSREFFVQKLLELTGFGPDFEIVPDASEKDLPIGKKTNFFIATLDEAYTKKSELGKRKTFLTHRNFHRLGSGKEEFRDPEFTTRYCALDVLEYALRLSDALESPENAALVVSQTVKRGGAEEAGAPSPERKKPKLVDFLISEHKAPFEPRLNQNKGLSGEHAKRIQDQKVTEGIRFLFAGEKEEKALLVAMKKAFKFTCEHLILKLDPEIYPNEQERLQEYVKTTIDRLNIIIDKYKIDRASLEAKPAAMER